MSKMEGVAELVFFGAAPYGRMGLQLLRSSSFWLAMVATACVLALGYPVWKAVALGLVLLLTRRFNAYWKCVDATVIALFVAAALYHSDVDIRQPFSALRSLVTDNQGASRVGL